MLHIDLNETGMGVTQMFLAQLSLAISLSSSTPLELCLGRSHIKRQDNILEKVAIKKFGVIRKLNVNRIVCG